MLEKRSDGAVVIWRRGRASRQWVSRQRGLTALDFTVVVRGGGGDVVAMGLTAARREGGNA